MSEPSKFVIEGREFVLSPLKLKEQMAGWSIVGSILLPIFASGEGLNVEALNRALQSIDRLYELQQMFAAVCVVDWDGGNGAPKKVPLKTFGDNIFARRSDILLRFVAECVLAEYGSFLDDRGRSVLSSLEDHFASLTASTGQSGE